jgi:hypothetical protein
MKNFRTSEQFVTTAGKNDRVLGYFCSIEYAEQSGESCRKNSEYTIWQRINGEWRAIRNRTVN